MTSATSDAGRVVVDPRFRARRIAVRKEAGRRRLKRLLALIAVAVVALTVVIVLKSPVLDVDEIAVSGAVETDAAAIIDAAGIRQGQPILLADLARAESAVEALPWVLDASVERDLPGSVRVEIVERVPLARVVGAGGAAVLVDESGVVVSVEVAEPVFPPYVSVVAGDELPAPGDRVDPALLSAVELAGRLRTSPPSSVLTVRTEPTVELELVGGGVVEFGDLDQLDDKVEAFRTMYARVDRTCLDTIDLRVPSHPVLTRREPCS